MVATSVLIAAFGVGSLALSFAKYTLQRRRYAALMNNGR
jgi:hypothetical protein